MKFRSSVEIFSVSGTERKDAGAEHRRRSAEMPRYGRPARFSATRTDDAGFTPASGCSLAKSVPGRRVVDAVSAVEPAGKA